MRTSFFPAIGAVLCLMLTACVTESVNPLSAPDTAKADPRLVGDWRGGTDDDPSTCRFSITKGSWMHVDILHPKEKRAPNEEPDSYDFFPTIIGKETFLNVVMLGKDDDGHPTRGYLFLRYKFSGNNVLTMWRMSQEMPAAAIHAGKLKGSVKQSGSTLGQPPRPDLDVTLLDSSANIAKYIQNSDLDELFSDKLNGFYRIKLAAK